MKAFDGIDTMTAFLTSFIIWAVLHSITASGGIKQRVRYRLGEAAFQGLYRLLYNLFAGVTFIPVLYLLATQVTNIQLWSIPKPWIFLAYVIQLVGLIGLSFSLWQTDLWEFAGLRQALAYFGGQRKIARSSTLITGGLYGIVRHPIYFFSLLILWFNPVVGLATFIFNLLATAYFWTGSYYEERRLSAEFGDAYGEYKQRVPRLIPIRFSSKGAAVRNTE